MNINAKYFIAVSSCGNQASILRRLDGKNITLSIDDPAPELIEQLTIDTGDRACDTALNLAAIAVRSFECDAL